MFEKEWSIPHSLTIADLLQSIRSIQEDLKIKKGVSLSIN